VGAALVSDAGRRIKLAPQDVYALGAHRGGIDERWFGSTTAAANEGAPPDEGLSYVVQDGKRAFTLKDGIALEGAKIVGKPIWDRYAAGPSTASSSTTSGRSRTTCTK